MKYSQQQLRDIDRHYENVQRQIKMTNEKARAIKSVLIDKQLPEDLLDTRISNDIENDEFARRALLNKYSRQILGSADIYEFQKDLIDSGLEFTFLNNFPEVLKESKNYRIATPNNVLNITRRIYNKNKEEIDLVKNNKKNRKNMSDMVSMLKQISDNLNILIQEYPNLHSYLQDQKNKVDATIMTSESVNDSTEFMKSLYRGTPVSQIRQSISTTVDATNPDTITDDSKIDTDPTGIISQISQTGLANAQDAQFQSEAIQEAPMKKLRFDKIESWKPEDENFQTLADLRDSQIDVQSYAEIIQDITGINSDVLENIPTKKKLYNYALNYINQIVFDNMKNNKSKLSQQQKDIKKQQDELRKQQLEDEKNQQNTINLQLIEKFINDKPSKIQNIYQLSEHLRLNSSNSYRTTITAEDTNRVKIVNSILKYYTDKLNGTNINQDILKAYYSKLFKNKQSTPNLNQIGEIVPKYNKVEELKSLATSLKSIDPNLTFTTKDLKSETDIQNILKNYFKK